MKDKNKLIKKIPYYFIYFRLILIPIIIILGFTKHFLPIIILIILVIISDFLDDYLAKKWIVQSEKKKILDVFCEKLLFISILLSLVFRFHILLFPLLMEILIGITNIYYYNKTQKLNILPIGQIKTVLLFIFIIIIFINIYHPTFIFKATNLMIINIQILTLISYFIDYHNKQFEKKQKEIEKKREERINDLEDKTIMLDKIEDLLKDYEKKDIL